MYQEMIDCLRYWRDCWREDLRYLGLKRFLWKLPRLLWRDIPALLQGLAWPVFSTIRHAALKRCVFWRDRWRCTECGSSARPLVCRWPEDLPNYLWGLPRLKYWRTYCGTCIARRNAREYQQARREDAAWKKFLAEQIAESEAPPAA